MVISPASLVSLSALRTGHDIQNVPIVPLLEEPVTYQGVQGVLAPIPIEPGVATSSPSASASGCGCQLVWTSLFRIVVRWPRCGPSLRLAPRSTVGQGRKSRVPWLLKSRSLPSTVRQPERDRKLMTSSLGGSSRSWELLIAPNKSRRPGYPSPCPTSR